MRSLRILTWHVHGSYLDSLVQSGHEFFLPVKPDGTGGRGGWGWPDTVHDVPEEQIRDVDVDLVLYQHESNRRDAPRILSDRQLRGPRVYLEHDPPLRAPDRHRATGRRPGGAAGPRHPVQRPDVGQRPHADARHRARRVRPGGRPLHRRARPRASWSSTTSGPRGRRLGLDVFEQAASEVPLDLVGMDAESLGGLGEVRPHRAAGLRGPLSVLLQPDPLHQPRAGRHRGDDGRHADRRAGDDRDGDGRSRTASRATSTPTSSAWSRRCATCSPTRPRPGGWARAPGGVALERFPIDRFARDWDEAFADGHRRWPRAGRGAAELRAGAGGATMRRGSP